MQDEVIKQYSNYLNKEKKLSNNTINSYLIDLKKYLSYLNEKEIKLDEVSENDIFSFLIYLEKSNVSVSTLSRTISSIKSFYDFLFLTKKIDSNPTSKLKKPKVIRDKVDVLTETEVEKILNSPDTKTIKGIRDKAILETLYGTGMKVSELIELDLDDINLDLEYIVCKSSKNSRIVPLSNITKKYISKYLNESRENIVKNKNEKALFVNSKGERFTRQGLWKIIKTYAKIYDIDKNVTPRMLRHSFAIHLLKNGADMSVVSKILGNTNLSSLEGYLVHIDKNIRSELKQKHPRT
ncbi:integrase/recombinase XerD [Alkalithermobacter thermoalcaliphilus JW-YL-7 = DSM 7308]|uniref:Integrase/recombinase XerD n=1 Tax=Alkalithermobacter thermoalcaliphilus JW-YL-7 = DSM 7308 TaxID=1121328 RepID=A0A150FRJ7_CLOPD|nr:Tyrosine recombinase xerC [[Clostridium] paradoxum JW-YL-7 = DSM 7308]SHK65590.1 integrase/recombinase XerD [[Clostridium] paradoxum JW-YL-7 = DSM 7308]